MPLFRNLQWRTVTNIPFRGNGFAPHIALQHLSPMQRSRHMRIRKALVLCLLPLALAGCSTTITNLTPRQFPRNAENMYPVEVMFKSNVRAIRKDTIRPYVQIGNDNYLMRRTAVVEDRWETLVPVAATDSLSNYRIKIDYQENEGGESVPNSSLSEPYQIRVE
jgi:hypothetical protein